MSLKNNFNENAVNFNKKKIFVQLFHFYDFYCSHVTFIPRFLKET